MAANTNRWTAEGVARLGVWMRSGEGRRCAIVFALALLVRLALAPYHGFFGDLDIYANWGLHLADHFRDFYSYSLLNAHGSYVHYATGPERGWVGDMPANYPPLGIYVFWAQMRVYALVAGIVGVGHGPISAGALSPVAAVCMKLAALAADFGTGVLLYILARRERGERWALGVTALYAFSPVVLLDGALWGQTDGIITFLVLLALLCATRRRAGAAGALMAAAILFKPQPFVLLPLLVLYLHRWAGWLAIARFAAAFAATAAAICLPFLLPPHPELFVLFDNMRQFHDGVASLSAFNLWWFSARFQSATAPTLGPLSPFAIGWALFGLTVALLARVVRRDPSAATLYFAAGVVALASFVLTVMQLERYLYPAVILFLVAAAYRPRYLRFALVAGATFFANAAIIVLINLQRLPWIDGGFWTHLPDPYYWPWAITLLIASANVALLVAALLSASITSPSAILARVRARVHLRPSASGSVA